MDINNNSGINKAYIPYGEEWVKEMMKFPKPLLIEKLKIEYEKIAALQPSTLPLIDQKDLHQQVVDHIRNYNLFDWDEALTGNEMSLLEDMFMSFNPLCPPGSIGFEEQKRHIQSVPLIDKGEDAIAFAEWMKENGWQSINLTMHDTKYTKTIWSSKWGGGQATSEQLYQLFKNKKQ